MAPADPGEGPSRSSRTTATSTRSRAFSPSHDRLSNPAKRPRTVGPQVDADEEPAFENDDDAAIFSQLTASVSDQQRRAAEIPMQAEEKSLGSSNSDEDIVGGGENTVANNDVSTGQEEEAANRDEVPPPQQFDDAMDVDQDDLPSEDSDGDSQSSVLSRGYFGDLMSDLSVDLDNLVTTYVTPQTTHPKRKDVASHLEQVTPFSRTDCRDLRHTLRKWVGESRSTRSVNYFCYRFEGTHPGVGFSALDLAGRDLALLKTFMEFVDDMPLEIFLVVLERSGDEEESSEDFLGRAIVDINGRELATHVPLQNVISSSSPVSAGLDSDSNAAFETSLLFVHRDSVVDFFMDATQDQRVRLPVTLHYYAERAAEPENRERLLFVMQDLFCRAWDIDADKGLSYFPTSLERIFRSALLIGDWEWFDLLASHAHGAIPLEFFPWARKTLIEPGVPYNDPEKAIQSAALSYPDVYMQCAAILHFVGSPPCPETRLWARGAVSNIMERMLEDAESSELGEKDGSSLVRLVGTYRNMKGLEEL
ncbi:hypothetical protein B0T14DRAFT_34478 [Immersiella caudata]|uniref:Uncharacterized protein n=1 Tax=Immersiella caudata TaxID=314043 RepID=A0AA40CCJ0_9PEZI|nr:hypothetical protein B0T14DRAFT_34478 [Immersiella caudata]